METDSGKLASQFRANGRGWVLLAIAVGWLFILGGRFLVPALLPQIKDAFGVSNTGGGIAITVIWVTYGLIQSPAGLLTDRLGERRLLVGSLVLSAVSAVGLSMAPEFFAFLVGCATFGVATGLYGPARGTVLSRTFPNADGGAIGVTLAAGSAGSAVLPFLAGALVGGVGWRYIVAGLFPPLAIAGGFAWWVIPKRESSVRSETLLPRELARDVFRAIRIRGVAVAAMAMTHVIYVARAYSVLRDVSCRQ